MSSVATLVAFTLASLILVVIPGPAVLYILGRGVAQGRRAAVVSTLGIETGTLIHVLAAVVGLSAVISSSALAYEILRYAGVCYLVFLGVTTLRSSPYRESNMKPPAVDSAMRSYVHGVLVQVLNPKVTLFFLAFLPQFVQPDVSQPVQILLLGAIFFAIATVSDLTYALLSGWIGDSMQRRPAFARHQRHVSGAIYLGLAALGIISGGRRSTS